MEKHIERREGVENRDQIARREHGAQAGEGETRQERAESKVEGAASSRQQVESNK